MAECRTPVRLNFGYYGSPGIARAQPSIAKEYTSVDGPGPHTYERTGLATVNEPADDCVCNQE